MARKNGQGDVVLVGRPEPRRNQPPATPGITDINHWADAYEIIPFATIIEKMLEMPNDMLGATIRSVIKDENQANELILLNAWCDRFKPECEPIRNMLKMKLATQAGMGGRARMEALFAVIRLLAPGMYRDILGLPKKKGDEEVARGPDYREEAPERT